MVRESYQERLQSLNHDIMELGSAVREALGRGLSAIRDGRQDMAQELDLRDDTIDERSVEIERSCTELIALQQPVASDLRQIISALQIVTDLERVADLAVNLGEYAAISEAFVLISKDELLDLGAFADEMLADSLTAFQERDAEQAETIFKRDQEMDERCLRLRTAMLTQLVQQTEQQHPEQEAQDIAANSLTVLWSIRDLERVADHACNICARTIYWVRADSSFI